MKLIDGITYLCAKYPYSDELSNARVTKMIYLADWRHTLDTGEQMTRIKWLFNHYGPWVPDVLNAARDHPETIRLLHSQTPFGTDKTLLEARPDARWPSLSRSDKAYLQQVVDSTKQLTFQGFLDLIYGTYPVRKTDRYDTLDLEALATRYWKEQQGSA